MSRERVLTDAQWERIAWRDLPSCFGPSADGVGAASPLCTDGTWDKIRASLVAEAVAAGDIDWMVSVDSTTNRGPPARHQRRPGRANHR